MVSGQKKDSITSDNYNQMTFKAKLQNAASSTPKAQECIPVLLFSGDQQFMHLLKFVFMLLHWESLNIQLPLQSYSLILKLLVAPQLQEIRKSFMSALNIYFPNWKSQNTKNVSVFTRILNLVSMFTHCRRWYASECFILDMCGTPSAFCIYTVIRGILNWPQYLLSLLARPDCLSLGGAFLQPEQCALVLLLFPAGLLQLLSEGLAPPLQHFNASMQSGALRALLQQLFFQPEKDDSVATVWKSSRSRNCTVYFYYLNKMSLKNNNDDVLC